MISMGQDKDYKQVIDALNNLKACLDSFFDGLEQVPVKRPKNSVNTLKTNVKTQKFDFEALYQTYPRKEGKARGLKIAFTHIKTEEDYIALSKAIERYKAHCARNRTEPQYIKQFSTFMNSWRDWLDPDVGTVEKIAMPEPEWMRKAREEEAKNVT